MAALKAIARSSATKNAGLVALVVMAGGGDGTDCRIGSGGP
jgi:hypothetical protein